MPAARNLLNKFAVLGIRASQSTNYMERRVLLKYIQALCFRIQDQCQACWNELTLNNLSQAQLPADWCKLCPYINGVSLFHQIASARSLNKPQTTNNNVQVVETKNCSYKKKGRVDSTRTMLMQVKEKKRSL